MIRVHAVDMGGRTLQRNGRTRLNCICWDDWCPVTTSFMRRFQAAPETRSTQHPNVISLRNPSRGSQLQTSCAITYKQLLAALKPKILARSGCYKMRGRRRTPRCNLVKPNLNTPQACNLINPNPNLCRFSGADRQGLSNEADVASELV